MSPFEGYAAPRTVEEAARLMATHSACLLAGGTDLVPRITSQTKELNPFLLNIRRIPELRGVHDGGTAIRIGALTTVAEIRNDPLLQESAAILGTTADCFASGQIRNSATIGGNVCNASPAGDLIIPLLLLEAEAELVSWSEYGLTRRTVPVCDFFRGPGETEMQPSELLTGFNFTKQASNAFREFRKFGVRPAMDIAVVSVGVSGQRVNGALREVRIAFGAVAPVPLRGRRTEAVVEDQKLDTVVIGEATRVADEEISPISDVRASAWYRRELVRTLLQRILNDVSL